MFDGFNKSIIAWLNDHASQGILVTDANLVVRSWNQWLERHSGRESGTVIGTSLLESFPELSARNLDVFYREALNGHAQVVAQRACTDT